MTKNYTKPIVTIDSGMAEGVYAASGATKGTLNVTYYGVWDRWGTNGGKGLAQASWSDLDGTITLISMILLIQSRQMMPPYRNPGLEKLPPSLLQAQQPIR